MNRVARALRRGLAAAVIVVALVGPAARPGGAQSAVDERRPAAPDGTVKITNPAGSVRVIGWWRDTVAVAGALGAEVRDVEFTTDERSTRIRAVLREEYRDRAVGGTDLDVYVPRRSHVAVRTREGAIEVASVSGALDLESTTGDLRVRDHPRFIYARSVGGDLEITGGSKLIRASSVAGTVTVTRAAGYVEVSTVSGDVRLAGRGLWEGRVSSVSGDIRFEGDFEENGSFAFENNSGAIELALPPHLTADFDLSTFGGTIETSYGPASGSDGGAAVGGGGREHSFSMNGGGTRIEVRTFKGPIRIERASRASR